MIKHSTEEGPLKPTAFENLILKWVKWAFRAITGQLPLVVSDYK